MATALVRWEPPRSLLADFERVVDDLFAPLLDGEESWFSDLPSFASGVEVSDEGDAFVVRAPFPEVREDQVRIELNGRRLSLVAEAEERRNGRRSARRWEAEVWVPEDADPDRAEAHLERGILEVRLPRKSGVRRAVLRITPEGVVREEGKPRRWRIPFARTLFRRGR